jgi:hypothetical protein
MSQDDPFFDIRRKEFLPASIDLVEHALIYYFSAPYNQLLREWRPDRPTGGISKLKSSGFRLLQIHLDGWQGLARYFTKEVQETRSHLILLTLHDEQGRTGSRLNYDPDTHNWRFQFGYEFEKERLSQAETSAAVMKIFGDEAPRIRRPPEAELPDEPLWSPEAIRERRERLRDTFSYTGPSYNPETGCFSSGRDADGRESYWQLVQPGKGVRHGIIAGPRGSGKTNALRLVQVEAYATTFFYLVVLDPTGRHDDTLWREYADIMAETIEDSANALQLLEKEVAARHRKSYKFLADGPAILITIEDAHILFDSSPDAAKSADAIARYGESVGIGLVVTVPDLNVGRFGGLKSMREAFDDSMIAVFGALDSYEMFAEGDE